MAKISRFYRAQPQEYISQFVPENLGLMQNALNQRQAISDSQQQQLDIYEDSVLQEKALPGFDTETLKQKRKQFDDFVTDVSGKDLSDPNVIRDISKQVRAYKTDEELNKIRSAYAWNEAAQKNMAELKAKGKLAPENIAEYQRRYADYTKEDGKGFTGEGLADNTFDPDAPAREQLEKFVDNLKANSITWDAENGQWINKHTRAGIGTERVQSIMKQNLDPFLDTQAGRQMQRRAAQNNRTIEQQFMTEANPVISERLWDKKVDTKTANSNYWKRKEEQEKQAEAFWENGVTNYLGTNFEDVSDIKSQIKDLKKEGNLKEAAKLESNLNKLNSEFSKTLSKEESVVIKFKPEDLLNKEKSLTGFLKSKAKIFSGNPSIENPNPEDVFKNELNNMTFEEKRNVLKGLLSNKNYSGIDVGEEVKKFAAETLGVNYDKLEERRNDYLSKGYVEETADILLDPGKAGKATRDYAAEALKTYVNDINYNVEGSERSLDDIMTNVNKQTIKLRSSSEGPVIVFKTLGDKTRDIPAETITVQYKGVGQGVEADKGVRQFYKAMTGGDTDKFNRIILDHKYAIEETRQLRDPYVTEFLNINKAEDVQYKKEGDNVNLYLNGQRQIFRNDEGEELDIRDIPTLIEVMKYQAVANTKNQ